MIASMRPEWALIQGRTGTPGLDAALTGGSQR